MLTTSPHLKLTNSWFDYLKIDDPSLSNLFFLYTKISAKKASLDFNYMCLDNQLANMVIVAY